MMGQQIFQLIEPVYYQSFLSSSSTRFNFHVLFLQEIYMFSQQVNFYYSICRLSANFETHNTKTKKEYVQQDITQIVIKQKLDQLF